MLLALVLAAGLAWWLHKRGELVPNIVRLGGSGAAALIAIRLLETGRIIPAILAGAAGAAWWVLRRPKPAELAAETEARALLGVAAGADASAIQAAWRAQIARVHPDAGGTAALASRVTAARDLLLARMER